MEIESDRAKTVVCIMSTWQSAQKTNARKHALTQPHMNGRGLKVIGKKLWPVSCPQGFIEKVPHLILTFDSVTQNK